MARRITVKSRNASRRNAMRASVSRIGLRSSRNLAFKNPYYKLLNKMKKMRRR